jgi:hypothetical protein
MKLIQKITFSLQKCFLVLGALTFGVAYRLGNMVVHFSALRESGSVNRDDSEKIVYWRKI